VSSFPPLFQHVIGGSITSLPGHLASSARWQPAGVARPPQTAWLGRHFNRGIRGAILDCMTSGTAPSSARSAAAAAARTRIGGLRGDTHVGKGVPGSLDLRQGLPSGVAPTLVCSTVSIQRA